MALDINALKSKLNSFKRTGGGDRDASIWKPKEGKTVIRIVPWKDNPSNPFIELYFHYLGNKTHLSPLSYGNRDPIAEFADALRSDQSRDPKERYAEARPFMPPSANSLFISFDAIPPSANLLEASGAGNFSLPALDANGLIPLLILNFAHDSALS